MRDVRKLKRFYFYSEVARRRITIIAYNEENAQKLLIKKYPQQYMWYTMIDKN